MKSKTLTVMAVATVCVVIAAFLLTRQNERGPSNSDLPLFQGLLSQINDVETITVMTQVGQVVIRRENDRWGVKDKYGYPADMGKVRETLIGLAELTILEPKTQNPELYKKLGLQDFDAERSNSTLIRLGKTGADAMAEIILGNRRPAKGNPARDEIYVRNPGNPQTWLVSGNLQVEKFPGDWLEEEVLTLNENRVHQVQITHKDGHSFVLQKENPKDQDFKILNLPQNTQIRSSFTVNNIALTLSTLSLDDVKPKAEMKFPPESDTTAILETYDGLRVTVHIAQVETKPHVMVQAVFDQNLRKELEPVEDSSTDEEQKEKALGEEEPETGKTPEKPEPAEPAMKSVEEVQGEVATLNGTWKDWVYIIPQFRAENISKRLEDLIEPEK